MESKFIFLWHAPSTSVTSNQLLMWKNVKFFPGELDKSGCAANKLQAKWIYMLMTSCMFLRRNDFFLILHIKSARCASFPPAPKPNMHLLTGGHDKNLETSHTNVIYSSCPLSGEQCTLIPPAVFFKNILSQFTNKCY